MCNASLIISKLYNKLIWVYAHTPFFLEESVVKHLQAYATANRQLKFTMSKTELLISHPN